MRLAWPISLLPPSQTHGARRRTWSMPRLASLFRHNTRRGRARHRSRLTSRCSRRATSLGEGADPSVMPLENFMQIFDPRENFMQIFESLVRIFSKISSHGIVRAMWPHRANGNGRRTRYQVCVWRRASDPKHGTMTGYQRGCGCNPCVAANTHAQRAKRAGGSAWLARG